MYGEVTYCRVTYGVMEEDRLYNCAYLFDEILELAYTRLDKEHSIYRRC